MTGADAIPAIEIWHGERQRTGHLGDAQDDFNLLGHIAGWRDLDTLGWSLNDRPDIPLNFRAFRRLATDGDFNADIPIARLRPGTNTVKLTARWRDGRSDTRAITIDRGQGSSRLPLLIDWSRVKDPQDVGQYVDGHWLLTPDGLRTAQPGYDRIFLLGERTWRDYEARATIRANRAPAESAAAGVGLIMRFTGHVVGGPEHFPSGQPKWGYRPFGAIGWIRWTRGSPATSPQAQYYPGSKDRPLDLGAVPLQIGVTHAVRMACETLPDDNGKGVTRYSFKIWPETKPEPEAWTWQRMQTSADALRTGGVALLAHQIDVTFGNIQIQPLPDSSPPISASAPN